MLGTSPKLATTAALSPLQFPDLLESQNLCPPAPTAAPSSQIPLSPAGSPRFT